MFVWVLVGADFHAGKEFEALGGELSDESNNPNACGYDLDDMAAGLISAAYRLLDIRKNGFIANKDGLEKTGIEGIWIYKDAGVRMAIRVPGDGRLETKDICLICSEFCDANASTEAQSRDDFLDLARSRLSSGRQKQWPF